MNRDGCGIGQYGVERIEPFGDGVYVRRRR
jgi:hypothetical protein